MKKASKFLIVISLTMLLNIPLLVWAQPVSEYLKDDFEQLTVSGGFFQKDPFVQSASTLDDIFVGDLALMSILYNEEKSFALINNIFIRVGDTLSGYIVSEILRDRIVLKNETGLYVLRFKTQE